MLAILETVATVTALLASIAGAASLYLGMPRQLYLRTPLEGARSRAYGAGFLFVAWLLWSLLLRPATGFFVVLTLCMASFILLPTLAAFTIAARRGRAS